MFYIFNINSFERQAIYSAICTAGLTGPYIDNLIEQISNPRTLQVKLRQGELGVIFRVLDDVISRYEGDQNSWAKAQGYRDAKNSLAAKVKMNFGHSLKDFN